MLVIGTASGPTGLRWSGRRHDDDSPGMSRGDTMEGLFEAVFLALHDGEQVAVGFAAPLGVPGVGGSSDTGAAGAILAQAESDSYAVRDVVGLLGELGRWRPWTVVGTSLPQWSATTSVLVWETCLAVDADNAALDERVDAFYALARARAERGAEVATDDLTNLAVVVAGRAGLAVDGGLGEPVVLVPGP